MISLIIPTYNESENIADTINKVQGADTDNLLSEIIVVDGGSTDNTLSVVRETGVRVLSSPKKGRACQMNYGASHAKNSVLYFLHADSIPPKDFSIMIHRQLESGSGAGCFRLAFDEPVPIMKLYAWFTRFDVQAFRYGDQSLFVRKKLFEEIGGFREDHIVMEDNEIIKRLKKKARFAIIPKNMLTSARKYRRNGFLRLQMVFTLIYVLYHVGVSQQRLVGIYKRLIS